MSIYSMVAKGTEGAYLSVEWTKQVQKSNPDSEIWMKEFHKGFVLADRERNGYDDSDFYAIVWDNDLKRFTTEDYGTTRFWTYPNYCVVDAEPWVYEAQEQLKAEVKAFDSAVAKIKAQEELESYGVPVKEVKALLVHMDKKSFHFEACIKLLATKTFRSSFRRSLCDQLRSWVQAVMTETNKYNTPFSPKQWECVLKNSRVSYSR